MNKITITLVFKLLLIIILSSCSDAEKLRPLDDNAIILAFGDSLTYGTGTSRNKSYPAELQTIIEHRVINAGVPGETSVQGLLRLPGLISQHHPNLIIIWHGANDILRKMDIKQTQDNIQQMINISSENNVQVILIGVPEFGIFLSDSPIYHALADKNHLHIENDVLGDILIKNTHKSDYVHPNALGYRTIAERIATLLKESGAI